VASNSTTGTDFTNRGLPVTHICTILMTPLQALGVLHPRIALTEVSKSNKIFSHKKKTSKSQTTLPKNTDG
jgi:hypothetical protein